MKYFLLFSIALSLFLSSCTKNNKTFSLSEIAILPKPSSITLGSSSFEIKNILTVSTETNDQKYAATTLINFLTKKTSYSLKIKKQPTRQLNLKKLKD